MEEVTKMTEQDKVMYCLGQMAHLVRDLAIGKKRDGEFNNIYDRSSRPLQFHRDLILFYNKLLIGMDPKKRKKYEAQMQELHAGIKPGSIPEGTLKPEHLGHFTIASRQALTPVKVYVAIRSGTHPLRAWREYKGMTLAEVAAKAGVSAQALSKHEQAGRPRKKTIQMWAKALDAPFSAITWGFEIGEE